MDVTTKKLKDGDSLPATTSDEETPRKKSILEDDKLEDQLTNEKLKNLQQIFKEADEDEGGGLDMDEFRRAMRQTMGSKVSDKELDRIFMKVDTNCDGTVDWDEYLTYMLLECREKDQMNEQARQPFPRYFRHVDSDHRDSITSLKFLPCLTGRPGEELSCCRVEPSKGKYISVGQDGTLFVWSMAMKQLASHVIEQPLGPGLANSASQTSKSVWITDCAYIARARVLVFSTTASVLLFYRMGRKNFYFLTQVTGLDACPVSLAAHDPDCARRDTDTGTIVMWGDSRGGVSGLTFHCPLMKTPINSRLSKNSRKRLPFADILAGKFDHISGFCNNNLHSDSVKQIKYCGALECFISCSKDSRTAMFLGDPEQRTTKYYFKVLRGINDFEYFKDLNIIVSGGYDAIVRVWNPYVPTKPSGMLRGHLSPVIKIHIDPTHEHVISIAENKEIRVHDLNSQTCIQTFFRKSVSGLGERIISASVFQPAKRTLILATNHIAVLEHQGKDLKDTQYRSHSKPVSCALYNPLFNQVVSASMDSTVSVWSLYTGEKVMQFKAHMRVIHGESKNVEITAISFDHTYRRLFTGARDGTVKVWNFNNGSCLRELTVYQPDLEVTSIVCSKQNIITAGWNKQVTVYNDKSEADDAEVCFLKPKHKEDILTVSHYPPALVASGSHDGQIMVFSLETKRLIVKADVTGQKLYPAHNRFGKKEATGDEIKCQSEQTKSLLKKVGQQLGNKVENNSPQNLVNDKVYSARRSAVEKVLFLPTREHSKDTASLFCACADGWIRAWSAHPDGEMKGEFYAARNTGDAMCTLTSTSDDRFLVSGDETGYIRVWDISHFCIRGKKCSPEVDEECVPVWSTFSFYSWHAHLSEGNTLPSDLYPVILPAQEVGVHLVNSFRGHTRHISSLDVASPPDTTLTLILSASPDCSVRLWTLAGTFIGIFGMPSIWNFSIFPSDLDIQENVKKSPNKRDRATEGSSLLPSDVRRVASSTTLRVLLSGRSNIWKSTRGIFKWFSAFSVKKEVLDDAASTHEDLESVLKSRSFILPRLGSTSDTNNVLGMSYKKTACHKPLPKLDKPIIFGTQCAAYHRLPCMDVDLTVGVPHMDALHDIQSRYKLPPLKGIPPRKPLKLRVQQAFKRIEMVANLAGAVKSGKRRVSNGTAGSNSQPSSADNFTEPKSHALQSIGIRRGFLPPPSQKKLLSNEQENMPSFSAINNISLRPIKEL